MHLIVKPKVQIQSLFLADNKIQMSFCLAVITYLNVTNPQFSIAPTDRQAKAIRSSLGRQ